MLVEQGEVWNKILDNVCVRKRIDAGLFGCVGGDAACDGIISEPPYSIATASVFQSSEMAVRRKAYIDKPMYLHRQCS